MTHEQKIEYMQIACNVAGFGFKHEHIDLIVSVYELILKVREYATIQQIANVTAAVKKRADIKSRSELLDKVSEKVE